MASGSIAPFSRNLQADIVAKVTRVIVSNYEIGFLHFIVRFYIIKTAANKNTNLFNTLFGEAFHRGGIIRQGMDDVKTGYDESHTTSPQSFGSWGFEENISKFCFSFLRVVAPP